MLRGAVGWGDMALKIKQLGIPTSESLHWEQAQMSLRWQRGPSSSRNVQEKRRSLISIQHQVTSHSQRNTLGTSTESPLAGLEVGGHPRPSAGDQAAGFSTRRLPPGAQQRSQLCTQTGSGRPGTLAKQPGRAQASRPRLGEVSPGSNLGVGA